MKKSTSKLNNLYSQRNLSSFSSTNRSGNSVRIAKIIARAGLCSRREAEHWIQDGRVKLNGKELTTPAVLVTPKDKILVDNNLIPNIEPTRLWIFHKPRGVITSNKDPEGRPTVFSRLPRNLPRLVSVGRLDFNTEGLLLLTNDGGLARILELPATGWLRLYRVRAHGRIQQEQLDSLREGLSIDGMFYGSIEAKLDRKTKDNCWLTVGLREGKNREVKNVLEHLGLKVNRLIRLSFGPYHLNELPVGQIIEIKQNEIINHLSKSQIAEAGLIFRYQYSNQSKSKNRVTQIQVNASPHRDGNHNKKYPKSTKKPKINIKNPKQLDKNESLDNTTKPRIANNQRNKSKVHYQNSSLKKRNKRN